MMCGVSGLPTVPPSSGTAYTAAWAGFVLALLSGFPIAVAVFFANQDGDRSSWQLALGALYVGAGALVLGTALVLAHRAAGALLIALGCLLVLAGSVGVTLLWQQAYGNVAFAVLAVAVFAVPVFVLSVLPRTRAYLRHRRAAAVAATASTGPY